MKVHKLPIIRLTVSTYIAEIYSDATAAFWQDHATTFEKQLSELLSKDISTEQPTTILALKKPHLECVADGDYTPLVTLSLTEAWCHYIARALSHVDVAAFIDKPISIERVERDDTRQMCANGESRDTQAAWIVNGQALCSECLGRTIARHIEAYHQTQLATIQKRAAK